MINTTNWQRYLENPTISTAYQLDKNTPMSDRLEKAQTFLAGMEYHIPLSSKVDFFDTVDAILCSKVKTYAIAFVGGATNGGLLYQHARQNLLTWRAIFEGAVWRNGWLY